MDAMGALNTFFTFQTAENTAKSAYALGALQDADRERELRARGWLRPSSTPGERAWVEAVLAAQMRARVEMKSVHPRPWPYVKVLVGGVVAFLAVAALMGAAKQHQVIGWLVGSGLVVVICGAAALGIARREKRRAGALARAIEVDGRCGWCGEATPHILEGEATPPRVFHALEIEHSVDPPPRA